MSRRFLLVGLTGGIATGKSTVADIFRRLGAVVIDADRLARDVVAPGEPALAEIGREFGPDVLHPDGTLDRKRLGAVVFGDAERRRRLEAITHPAIRARFQARLQALADEGFEGLVLFDAPVMIESGGHRAMDRLVVVVADEATQLARLMARDGIGREEALSRIRSQMAVAEKARLADHVIDNSGERAATEARTREVHAALMREANEVRASESAKMAKFKERGSLEAFSESYEHTKLGPLDDRFYGLTENLSQLRIARIRQMPEQFSGE